MELINKSFSSNNNFLGHYLSLDREIKSKSKEIARMKKDIVKFLERRENRSFITNNYIALLQSQMKTVYSIPDEIKIQYKSSKEYLLLKVAEKQP